MDHLVDLVEPNPTINQLTALAARQGLGALALAPHPGCATLQGTTVVVAPPPPVEVAGLKGLVLEPSGLLKLPGLAARVAIHATEVPSVPVAPMEAQAESAAGTAASLEVVGPGPVEVAGLGALMAPLVAVAVRVRTALMAPVVDMQAL